MPRSSESGPDQQLYRKTSALVSPTSSWSQVLAGELYVAYRLVVILASMLALAVFSTASATPPEKPLSGSNGNRPDFVTGKIFSPNALEAADHAALVRKVHGKLRMLRLVLERIPRRFIPYKQWPKYKLTYYVEKLECGHERFYFPQAGPMAKRRNCAKCALAAMLPEKKPAASVGVDEQAREKA